MRGKIFPKDFYKKTLWRVGSSEDTLEIGDSFMVEKTKVKIRVAKTPSTKEVFGDAPPFGETFEGCTRFKVGQEFITEGEMPEGFCTWAWNNIYQQILTLMFGGNFPWMKEKGTGVFCCTDGLRPVVFELRRIE